MRRKNRENKNIKCKFYDPKSPDFLEEVIIPGWNKVIMDLEARAAVLEANLNRDDEKVSDGPMNGYISKRRVA